MVMSSSEQSPWQLLNDWFFTMCSQTSPCNIPQAPTECPHLSNFIDQLDLTIPCSTTLYPLPLAPMQPQQTWR